MEVTHSAPTADSYTPFSVHQSQTPESFFSGPPVLYHHSPSTTLLINSHELQTAPAIAEFTDTAPSSTNGTATYTNGDTETEDAGQELSIPDVGVWVTSESVANLSRIHATDQILTPSQTISAIFQLQECLRLNIISLHLPPRHPRPYLVSPSVTLHSNSHPR